MDVISSELDDAPDPYAPLRSLANGWRVHAHDLLKRSDEQGERAWFLNRIPWRDRNRLDPDPEQLSHSSRINKAYAATLMKTARDLDDTITRAVERAGATS